jgi:RNA-splicing ligase RtcB
LKNWEARTKMDQKYKASEKKVVNYSDSPLILALDTSKVKRARFLPDYCPGRGIVPTGSVITFDRETHIPLGDFLGTDVGCGMRLVKFGDIEKEFIPEICNNMASYFLENPKGLGSLGKGNHFLTFYKGRGDTTYALIHAGSREEGIELHRQGLEGGEYLEAQEDTIQYAIGNRKRIQEEVETQVGRKGDLVLDSVHNSVEATPSEIIYRKGATKALQGQSHIVSSSMGGKALLVEGGDNLEETVNSLCHGTGRVMSRSEARKNLFFEDPNVLNGTYFPYFLSLEHFSTELPPCYRSLDSIMPFIKKYTEVLEELQPLGSVMI